MKLTIRQFSEKYKLLPQSVNKYVERGKLIAALSMVKGKNIKTIDENNILNKQFIIRQLSKIDSKNNPAPEPKKTTTKKTQAHKTDKKPHQKKVSVQKKPKKTTKVIEDKEIFEQVKELQAIDRRRSDKLKIEIQLKELEYQKKLGKLMPTDTVNNIFNVALKTFCTKFYHSAKAISKQTVGELGGTIEDSSKIENSLITIINSTIEESIQESKKSLLNYVENEHE